MKGVIYYVAISKGDIFTCEDNMLFSHVKISSFRTKAHVVFHWCLYNEVLFQVLHGYHKFTAVGLLE